MMARGSGFRPGAAAAALFSLVGFFVLSGSLTTPLTPPGATSAPKFQALAALIGVVPACLILLRQGAVSRILGRSWPVLVPVAFAVLSMTWSIAPDLTLRRAAALGLTTMFGLWIAIQFSPRGLLALVVWGAVLVIGANLAQIVLAPDLGIHQRSIRGTNLPDVHVGKWRGLFGHKNDFGRAIAFAGCLCMTGALAGLGGRLNRILLAMMWALALFLALKAASSQALLLLVVVPAIMAGVAMMRGVDPGARAFLCCMALPVLALILMSAQLVFAYVLGLLGRDASLTGRTDIWEGTLMAMRGSELLGGGYGAGWEIIGVRLTALTGISVGHAHNGYLDLAADLGWTGLALAVGVVLVLGWSAFQAVLTGEGKAAGFVGVTLVVFTLVGNWAGSFLLLYNTIFWALTVAIWVQLADLSYSRPSRSAVMDLAT